MSSPVILAFTRPSGFYGLRCFLENACSLRPLSRLIQSLTILTNQKSHSRSVIKDSSGHSSLSHFQLFNPEVSDIISAPVSLKAPGLPGLARRLVVWPDEERSLKPQMMPSTCSAGKSPVPELDCFSSRSAARGRAAIRSVRHWGETRRETHRDGCH